MSKADETVALIKEVQDQAAALGLTWNLRMATVIDDGTVLVGILLDGDDGTGPPVAAISLVGAVVANSRVMTLAVPPHSLFVIATLGGTVARQLTNRVYQAGTTNLTLTAAPQPIIGATVTVSTEGAAQWEVNGVFDFGQSAAGAASPTFTGYLYVDGVQQATLAVRQAAALAVNRQSTPQNWSGSFTTGGSHVFDLRADVSAVSGTSVVRAASTTLLVKTYE